MDKLTTGNEGCAFFAADATAFSSFLLTRQQGSFSIARHISIQKS
jgi:hypothetical protein